MFATVWHADWSVSPGRRKASVAHRAEGGWRLEAPSPAGDVPARLRALGQKGRVLAGFDFPIGVPAAYGALTGLPDFEALLGAIGSGAFARWHEVCATPAEVSLHRPFYPAGGGGKGAHSPATLARALGLDRAQLLRACDRRPGIASAAPLFWTLGGNQVGKAALSGWLEVLRPLRAEAHLWPFDGPLAASTAPITLAEVYPARFTALTGARPPLGKRRAANLAALAPGLRATMARLRVTPTAALAARLDAGFAKGAGDKADDDAFDSVLGALGIIAVLEGTRGETEPATPLTGPLLQWEGWMFGG